jgi:glutamine amidotransferase
MCRMATRIGSQAAPLSVLLSDPPHSLYEQAYRPRRQYEGTVNVDGTAIVWWPREGTEPLRYATERPPWSDPNLLHLAPRLQGTAQLAAVRSGTPGLPYGVQAAAPFLHDGIAVAHNGRVDGIRGRVGRALLALLPDDLLGALDVLTDSTLLAATVAHLRRVHPEAGLTGALAATVAKVEKLCADAGLTATLTLLACDGSSIAGVRAGIGRPPPSLFTLAGPAWQPDATLAASEPLDGGSGWVEVPDRHLVELRPATVTVTRLEQPSNREIAR